MFKNFLNAVKIIVARRGIEMTTYKLIIYYLRHVFRQLSSLSWSTPGLFFGIFHEIWNDLSIKQGQISFVIKETTGCISFKSQ